MNLITEMKKLSPPGQVCACNSSLATWTCYSVASIGSSSMSETDAMPACQIDPAAPGHTMSCMEVWGGNQGVDTGVQMAGLDAWIYSRPYGKASAGGDVYYVSSCATGRITR